MQIETNLIPFAPTETVLYLILKEPPKRTAFLSPGIALSYFPIYSSFWGCVRAGFFVQLLLPPELIDTVA